MRQKITTFILAGCALGLAGCKDGGNADEQNIVLTNEIPANAEFEALPPDESSATPSNELANGEDSPDVSDLNATSNGY